MKKDIRKIEVVEMKASDIKKGFGNPRKCGKKKLEELKRSMEMFGDFGIFIIDEDDNIIGGNQRLEVVKEINPEQIITCKRLIGYTEAEKKAINIKDNTHAGEWDLDLLADWTADLTMDLGLDINEKEPSERKITEMELIRYEKYDYVMIVCRNEIDYGALIKKLGLENGEIIIAKKKNKKRAMKARAIWYDDIAKQIIAKEKTNMEKDEE